MGGGGGGGGLVGAVAGSALGGPIGAMMGGGLGMSMDGANAAANAANDAAAEQKRYAIAGFKRTSDIINPASVAALAQMDQALAASERQLSRSEDLVKNIDPAILEASQQALKLLRGEKASSLGPLEQQRNFQREKLISSLREQYGPGGESSSAGLQALRRFDMESNSLFSSAQQGQLGNLSNFASQFSGMRGMAGADAINFANLATNRFGIAGQQAATLQNAWAPVAAAAGGQFAGDLMRAQYQQNMGNQLFQTGTQIGTSILGMAGGAMGGGAAKASSAPNVANVASTSNNMPQWATA